MAFAIITPKDFLAGGLANLAFRPITESVFLKDTVYVATPEETDPTRPEVTEFIRLPKSDEVVFVVVQPR